MAPRAAEFDRFADDYAGAIGHWAKLAGGSTASFARGRVAWLALRLAEREGAEAPRRPRTVMDFGCGTGTATPFLLELLGAESIIGVDPSARSLDIARTRYGSGRAAFFAPEEYEPDGSIDVAYCNGVFHHIPPAARADAVRYVARSLRPGGVFSLWENNPLHPLIWLSMGLGEVDAAAHPLHAREAARIVREGGLTVLRTDSLFTLPGQLPGSRRLDPLLSRLPFGAQYQVLAVKNGPTLGATACKEPRA